jgi:hypothetical protein
VTTTLAAAGRAVLGPPHRFCDQRCERCPLTSACPAAHRVLDEPAAPMMSDARRLRSCALQFAAVTLAALQEAIDAGLVEQEIAAEPIANAFAVAGRVGRLLAAPAHEAAPHLLALEHLLARVDGAMATHEAAVARASAGAQRRARWELGRKLEPLFGVVTDAHRRELGALMHAGTAPPPFCAHARRST